MPEKDQTTENGTGAEGTVAAAADDAFFDEDEMVDDLLDEQPTVEAFDIDDLMDEAQNGDTEAGEIELEEDELLTDDELLADDDLFADDDEDEFAEDDMLVPHATVGSAQARALERRLERLEAAARTLAEAEVVREDRRVRRKVTAATTGAGAIGFIPILLQLINAIDLPPELTATLSTVAAALGAAAFGWLTPERTPPLPSDDAYSLQMLGRRSPAA
jgi:hypothetical protein